MVGNICSNCNCSPPPSVRFLSGTCRLLQHNNTFCRTEFWSDPHIHTWCCPHLNIGLGPAGLTLDSGDPPPRGGPFLFWSSGTQYYVGYGGAAYGRPDVTTRSWARYLAHRAHIWAIFRFPRSDIRRGAVPTRSKSGPRENILVAAVLGDHRKHGDCHVGS